MGLKKEMARCVPLGQSFFMALMVSRSTSEGRLEFKVVDGFFLIGCPFLLQGHEFVELPFGLLGKMPSLSQGVGELPDFNVVKGFSKDEQFFTMFQPLNDLFP